MRLGFNHNLHAHVLFYGPYIEQKHLAEVWNEVSGHQVVWIKKARTNLLKYVSKLPADDPELIGQLEVAFYKCRRVHTVGIFYNFTAPEDASEASHLISCAKQCPICGSKLHRILGNAPIKDLALRGIVYIGEYHPVKERKSWVN